MLQKILVIVGPTAVGKSALAVEIAQKFNGEIVSADSRQVYRGLDVGTGKITKEEMRGVPHHLLDVASPQKQFSSAEYQKMAREKITEIFSRNKLPLLVGGTGHYIDAALGRIAIPEVPPNPALRKRLEKKTTEELFEILKKINLERAKYIDAHNPRRLVRAIEIAYARSTRRAPVSEHAYPPPARRVAMLGSALSRALAPLGSLTNHAASPLQGSSTGLCSRSASVNSLEVVWLGLTLPPDELKKKIITRLFSRIREQGMLEEVRRLHRRRLSWKRMEALGLEYRYISRHLRGLLTETEMTEKLQTEIWRYAKRQMTWFKRNKEIRWFRPSQKKEIFGMLKSELGD